MVGYEDYPVNFYPMRFSFDDIALLKRTAPNQVIISDGQAFNWQLVPGDRAPSANELRVLTYSEMAAGAKGVLFYTYYDGAEYTGAWNLPEVWEASKVLKNELQEYSRIIVHKIPLTTELFFPSSIL